MSAVVKPMMFRSPTVKLITTSLRKTSPLGTKALQIESYRVPQVSITIAIVIFAQG
jgi:hypothetical protein